MRKLALILTMAGLLAIPAMAAQDFTPSDDTYAKESDTSPNGGEDVLRCKARSPADSTIRVPYIEFNLSSLTETISGASLTLKRADDDTGDFTFEVFGINDGQADEDFDEAAAVYSTFDSFSSSQTDGFDGDEGATPVATSLGTFTIGTSEDLVVTGTALDNFIKSSVTKSGGTGGNDIVTFAIVRQTLDSSVIHDFASKEHQTLAAPTLTVPEPATMAVLALGGLGVLLRRRRA